MEQGIHGNLITIQGQRPGMIPAWGFAPRIGSSFVTAPTARFMNANRDFEKNEPGLQP
jgi:hypothetical protein